jgi:iron complex outermembrane receptor protein
MTTRKSFQATCLALLPFVALADDDRADSANSTDEVVVIGRSVETSSARIEVERELLVDTAAALREIPGATVNRNGPITGIAQYRGMFGDRVAVDIDQLGIVSGGPNAMDAPLSYMSPMMTEELVVARGIASVSLAPETIGGHISTRTSRGSFGAEAFGLSGMLGTRFSSNGGITTSAARLTAANSRHRVSIVAELDDGDDLSTPVGDIIPTRLERDRYDLSYAYDDEARNLLLFAGKLDTGRTGTPALPMDIIYIDTELFGAQFGIDMSGSFSLEGRLHYNDVGHGMDNFSLRQGPMAMRQRVNTTAGSGTQFYLAGAVEETTSTIVFGIDGIDASHESTITNPNNEIFRVDNFVDVGRTLVGGFVEWRRDTSNGGLEIGGRINHVSTDAGEVAASGMMGMMGDQVDELADAFNSSRRDLSWSTFDLVAKYRYIQNSSTEWSVELGRKSRAPSYQELYLWLPMQATGGLADGRTYIGNLGLEEERSNEIVIGSTMASGRFAFSPQVYYRRVDDYILGSPATDPLANSIAMMMSGGEPLQFTNVDAEIWGVDAAWSFALTDKLLLDGIFSMVRGQRTDINDDLYRLSPFNGSVGLAYKTETWSFKSEVIGFADQEKVSAINNETETSGYWLVNLGFAWNPLPALRVEARVDNLLDETYQNHVTGINRAAGSDIPVGERIYGVDRTLSAGITYSF